jgi:hypothetical protein
MLLFSPWHDPLSCQSHSCATGFGSRRVSAISNTVLAVDRSGASPGYPWCDDRKPKRAPLSRRVVPSSGASPSHSLVCRALPPCVSCTDAC